MISQGQGEQIANNEISFQSKSLEQELVPENKAVAKSNDKQSSKSTAEVDSTSQSDEDQIIDAKTNENINKIQMMAQMFTYFSRKDDYKIPGTAFYGGFQLHDKELQVKLRSVATELLKSVGKKLLSGNFNLTAISFPIKCMSEQSLLMTIPKIQCVFSFYMNYAASIKNPIERMKAVITSTISFLWKGHQFEKPLNPVLGETYQAKSADGGMIYVEQTSHHPPRSHILIEGPDKRYIMHGWNEYSVKAYINSAVVIPTGHKTVKFHDGQTIVFNNPIDTYYNITIGKLYQWVSGKIEFRDKENDIYAFYEIGKCKNRTQEYFEGEITHRGKTISKIFGNYCGFVDFDYVRFFDIREIDAVYHPYTNLDPEESLPSDSTKRQDSRFLQQKDVNAAQEAKEQIEALQRHDRQLQIQAQKRKQEQKIQIKK